MEYLRTDTVSVGTLYRKAAKLSRGAGAYFCKHFVPAGAQGGWSPADLAAAVFAGGLAFFAASLPCLSGRRRGLGGFGRLPALPLVCFLSPIPPPPFPPGRGRIKVILCKGLRPLHPRGLNPRGAGSTCWGFLSGRFYKCRRRSNAGVPGAHPPAKKTFCLPQTPPGGGGGPPPGKKKLFDPPSPGGAGGRGDGGSKVS